MSAFAAQPGVTVYRELEVDTLPATIEMRGSKILGVLGMFFGGFFSLLPLIALAMAVAEEGWSRDVLVGLAWFVVPFGLFVALFIGGYSQFVQRTVISLDGHEVRWQWRTWRGTRERAEPLAGFEGIRSLHRSDSDDGDLYDLLLVHREEPLSVLLYRANRPPGTLERWRHYCRVFRQAPLEVLTPEQTLSCAVEDIGRPVWELLREGRVAVPEPGPVPAGVTVDAGAGDTVIQVHGRPVLSVGPTGVRAGGREGQFVPIGDIETVTVEIEPGVPRRLYLRVGYRLPLDGVPGGALHISAALLKKAPPETLVWLQRFVLRTLAGV